MKDIEPLVSICCITYNHENYIRDAIVGFLMQKTSFPIEIIIHDDASTDNTAQIIKEYEDKYPDLFCNIFQNENQWSKGGGSIFARFVYPQARGKYIALCEGDDYWTDPLKLQKQVDFLENNKDYILTVGGYLTKYITDGNEDVIIRKVRNNDFNNGYTFTLHDSLKFWLTQPLTALFRNKKEIFNKLLLYTYSRDTHLFYHLLKEGKGFYFTEILGVYNRHDGGVFSSQQKYLENYILHFKIYKELYKSNKDEFSRLMYYRSAKTLVLKFINNGLYKKNNINLISVFFQGIKVSSNIKELVLMFSVFIPEKTKSKFRKI